MAGTEASDAIPVRGKDDYPVEVGQLPDERQFIGAVLQVEDGWMAVVHFFSSEGEHVDTEHASVRPGGDEPPETAVDDLERMLRRLEPYREDAATVCAFEIEVLGRTLGLSRDRESGGMRLEPGGPVLAGEE